MSGCPYGDVIVACFLDGDGMPLDGATPLADPAAHLAGCEDCREQLARARRLDALLARSSGVTLAPQAAARLLARVQEAVAVPAPRPASSWPRRWAGRAALVAAGFAGALALGLQRREPPARPAPEPAPGPAVVAVTPADHGGPPAAWLEEAVLLPDLPRGAAPPHHAAPAPSHAALEDWPAARLEQLALQRGLERTMASRLLACRPALWRTPAALGTCARDAADRLRVAALQALTGSTRPGAAAALVRVLAGEPRGPLLDRFAAELRARPEVRRQLERRLAAARVSDDAVRAAALLGGPALDRALADAVAGDVARTERAAAAAAAVAPRPGAVPLLLELWADLERRNLEADGVVAAAALAGESAAEARARRWFGSLPAVATAELVDAARRAVHAGQRRRCLLALAARGDAAAADYLLAVVAGRRFEESVLAAHALGRCPAAAVAPQLRAALDRARRPELLLAALASTGEGSGAWGAAPLTDEERRFLASGPFGLEQFSIAVALLRQSDLPSY